jgi:hypothetical protein
VTVSRSAPDRPGTIQLDVETIAEKITTLMNDASSVLEEEISAKIQSLMPDFQAAELLEEFTRINRPPGTR